MNNKIKPVSGFTMEEGTLSSMGFDPTIEVVNMPNTTEEAEKEKEKDKCRR